MGRPLRNLEMGWAGDRPRVHILHRHAGATSLPLQEDVAYRRLDEKVCKW